MNAEIDISGVVLKTERLTLRSWKEADLDDFYEYASVDGVGQAAGWLPHESREQSLAILTKFIEGKKTFAVELDGRVVGSVGIEKYNEAELPELNGEFGRELGFVLAKSCWGRGLMTEAVREVIRYCFDELHLDFLVCGHFLGNERSARVQAKCGFLPYKMTKYETQWGEVKECRLSVLRNPCRK